MRCYVLEQTQKSDSNKRKIINLSLRASLINKGLALKHLSEGFPVYGCVVSQEDTGYVIEAGVSGVNFFLPVLDLSLFHQRSRHSYAHTD